MQVEFRAARTLGLLGPLASEDADQLIDAMASVGPGGPITLDLTGVTSIDDGGVAAMRGAMKKVRDIGNSSSCCCPRPTRSTRSERQGWTRNR